MTPAIASALTPLLRRIDPEMAHRLALRALRFGLAGTARDDDPALAVNAMGLRFANPVGLAAGFDKDAVAVTALQRLGFGFVETGTVTPLPQPGNPRPRLFRLTGDRAVINRMGFNNAGLAAYVARLAALPRGGPPVGANLGINKTGADPERDYPALVAAVAPHVDYIVINVSSPNTPGLRDLQGETQLRAILRAIAAGLPQRPPLLVKVAPDLALDGLSALVETCVAEGVQGLIVSNTTVSRPPGLRSPLAREAGGLSALVETCVAEGVQGLIVSNTTVSRPPGLRSPLAREAGGLSGAPLFPLATAMLASAYLLARGRLTLIGVGGVQSGQDAFTKIAAGASLVQVYSAFAYAGPALIPRLKTELAAALRAAGFARIEDAIGCQAERLAGAA